MKIAEIRAQFPMYSDLTDGELVRGLHKKFYADIPYQDFLRKIDFREKVDPTADMSGTEKFAAGAGKAVVDLGLGGRQIGAQIADAVAPRSQTMSGLVTGQPQSRSAEIQKEVDEVKARDAALMDTGAGFAGNITSNVAMSLLPGLGAVGAGKVLGSPGTQAAGKLLLGSPANIKGLATQGGLGATQAAVQPVATGESRLGNATFGLAAGAVVPALAMGGGAAKAAIEPLYEGGRNAILSRALREATGPNADAVAARLADAKVLVPGSNPTAAEVGQSGGLAALQRAAAAFAPEEYAARGAQQNAARVAALRDIAGDEGTYRAADNARKTATAPMYETAYRNGFDPASTGIPPELTSKLGELSNRPAVQAAIAEARKKALNEGIDLGEDVLGSVRGVDYVKRALGDQMGAAAPDDLRILQAVKDKLVGTADQLSPEYAAARQTYQDMSKPINQMDVGREFLKKTNALTDNIKPEAYAQALRDADRTAAKATGFHGAELDNVMTRPQLNTLGSIEADLARSVSARDLGRGAGSDTVQKLSMANLLHQSGIPEGALNFPMVGRAGNWLYKSADEKMQNTLADALLNPQKAASIMTGSGPNPELARLAEALRMSMGPAAMGSAPAMLDAR